jgi:hypothetical protein
MNFLKRLFTRQGTETMFTTLTRVYVKKGSKSLNKQSVTVRLSEIAMVRASNRLGYPDHRATVTLASGIQIDTKETAAEINRKLGVR